MSDATPTEHDYIVAAEHARQVADEATAHFEAIAAEFHAVDPAAFSHYASLFAELEPEPEHAAPEPEPITTLPGPRPTSLDGAIREMLSEQRARRAAG
jgi:hypothetical protein